MSRSQVGWWLWLWWVFASTVGWTASRFVAPILGSSENIIQGGTKGLVVGGIICGVLQWLVLRRYIIRTSWWILANVIAALVVVLIVFGIGKVSADIGWVLGASLFGPVVGVLQWLLLRRQVDRAGWWVLASIAGWTLGMTVGSIADWAGLGAVYGVVTGFALVALLRQGTPQ